MLILYTGTTCPFCRKVEDYLNDKGVDYKTRDIHENPDYLEELLELGGKRQIPFLIDEERGVSLYESDDIIDYVEKFWRPQQYKLVLSSFYF